MKLFNKFLFVSAILLLGTAFSSCNNEDDYIEVTYNYSCSPDLLEFVIPVIHYIDENGKEKFVELQSDMFNQVNKGYIQVTLISNGNESKTECDFTSNQWSFKKKYDGLAVKDEIKVTYKLKDKDITLDSNKIYNFYHGLFSWDASVYVEGNLTKMYSKENDVVKSTIVGGADAKAYVDRLLYISENLTSDIIAMKEK